MINYYIQPAQEEDLKEMSAGIKAYNKAQVPWLRESAFHDIDLKAVDDNGALMGGIVGTLNAWNCLHVELLWVREDARAAGLGSRLLAAMEHEAKALGGYMVYLDTYDFQAKGFYLKHGYEVCGIVENCPQDHAKYFLKKQL